MKKNIIAALVILCILVGGGLLLRGGWPFGAGPVETPIPVAPPAPTPSAPVTITDIPDEVGRAPIEAPAPPTDLPDPPGLVIAGIVTTAAETPAAGAIVAAYNPDTAAIRATAGDDGRFRVVGLRPGPYRVSAALEHYNETAIEGIQAGAANVALVLLPLSAVEGNVIDGQANKPLPKFDTLYLPAPPGDDSHWQNIVRGETTTWTPVDNDRGRYRIEDVASNTQFAVAVRAEGFEPAYAVVPPVKPGETANAADIALLPEARILGHVVSGNEKRPLSGADIFFGTEARGRTAARSNPNGQFTIGQLPPGAVTLTAAHPDHLPATVQATLTRGKETDVEIVLGGGGSIQGTVLDGATPLARQNIFASRLKPPRVRKDAITDDTGAYTIEGIPPGDVEVIAKLTRPGEMDPVPIRLQKQAIIEDGQATIVDFQLADASCSIEGAITIAGEPPAVAMIKGFVAGESGDTFFNTSAMEDGTYAIHNLPAGQAWLEVTIKTQEGQERRKNIPVQIPAGQTVRQDIQIDASATVLGTVSTLAQNEVGEVMAVMGPYNFNPAQIDIDELERIEVAITPISQDGTYRLAGLDPGTYTIIVVAFDPDETDVTSEKPSIRSTSQTITLTTDQELHLDLVIS